MMAGLSFLSPFILAALVVLPALYFLLKLTPPPPRRIPLPTLPLVKDLLGQEREPARTPWWLLLIRLALAGAIILAASGPRWQPHDVHMSASAGPLLLLIDNSWASAPDWAQRIARANQVLDDAASRPVYLIASQDEDVPAEPVAASVARTRLQAVKPVSYTIPRTALLDAIETRMSALPEAHLVWISDGLTNPDEAARITQFHANLGARLFVVTQETARITALFGAAQDREGLDLIIRRASLSGPDGLARAFDDKGRVLAEQVFRFDAGAMETRARFVMPIELRNDIARLEISDAHHAGGVHLVDAGHKRRRVALVSGETTDTAQALVSARYFITRALEPYAELREPKRGVPDPIKAALEDRPDLLVLVDIGTLSGPTADLVTRFVEQGGMLIRFAGPGLAAASDTLLPVRLRKGGRVLGGALSWDKPKRLAPFPEASPFFGLTLREDIRIERQVLAEPDLELSRLSWAILDDGTPLVTGIKREKGHIVLFHVTGDTGWSNLPLSGTFVEMLRRCLQQSASLSEQAKTGHEKLPPRLALDGFGTLTTPPAQARAIDPRFTARANRDHPPGFYGSVEASLAVNTLVSSDQLLPMPRPAERVFALDQAAPVDFRPMLMILAALLLGADSLAVLLLGTGGLRLLTGFGLRTSALVLGFGLIASSASPLFAQAGNPPLPQIRAEDLRSSLKPRLAYVITGNRNVDETSRAGLLGLGQVLGQRTSIDLDEPIGLDPMRDELVFYSMIYWPIIADQPRPQEAAIRAIDQFMKQGGTVIFDTRDAFIQRPGGQPTPETRALRLMLAALDIPALEPVPRDHVLTKTFYLLDRMIGRYAAGETWVEAISERSDAKAPVRAGDRVSPIIITSNDLAAAWAVDRLGRPLFPLVPGEPRQREMALRTGVNLMMYVMTGNYKADQVHIPALLERLGQ